MHFLDPLEITDTHVVVRVPHFSAFGIVKKILSLLKSLFNNEKRGQVLLFLGKPNPKTKRQKLTVFLLSRNISLEKVRILLKVPDDSCLTIFEPVFIQC